MPNAAAGEFRQIAQGLYLEGLAVDRSRGLVWYSDVIGGGVHGVRADGTAAYAFDAERKWTGGIMLNADGAVLTSGGGGIRWNHPETGQAGWLIEEIDGAAINGINEMAPDGAGGLYFGTVDIERIEAGEPARPAAIYRLSAARELTLVAGELGFANGMARSADGSRLYYNDTFDGTYVFDVRPDLSLGQRRRLLAKDDSDGMAMDAEGTLWVTGYKSREITRLRPDGTLLEPVPVPDGAVTQIRFGGADLQDVYLTSVPVEGGDDLAVGVQPTEQRSFLFKGRSTAAGLEIPATGFRLVQG